MRNPRIAFVVALALAACSEPGPAGPPGDPSEQLRAEVDALKVQMAMLVASGAGQKPHLVDAATEEDFGVYIGPDQVLSPAIGGVLLPFYGAEVLFSDPGCHGDSRLSAQVSFLVGTFVALPTGTAARYTAPVVGFNYKSKLSVDAVCVDVPGNYAAASYVDTAMPVRRLERKEVRVEYR